MQIVCTPAEAKTIIENCFHSRNDGGYTGCGGCTFSTICSQGNDSDGIEDCMTQIFDIIKIVEEN